MIDPDGYRPNVGIVLMRPDGRVFWARRVRRDGWQFPQGGMNTDETPVEAMYRELREETGLLPEHVEILGATPGWLRYRLPHRAVRHNERHVCIGQKQVWFLLRLVGRDRRVLADQKPEFDAWRWAILVPMECMTSSAGYMPGLRHLAPFARWWRVPRRCRRCCWTPGYRVGAGCARSPSRPPLSGMAAAVSVRMTIILICGEWARCMGC